MNSDEVVRAFVAVELGDAVRSELAGTVRHAQRLGGAVRWVRPEAMHITLAFLGDIFGSHVASLCPALDAAAANAVSFDAEVKGIGFFGRPESPRVIWAGVGGGSDQLKAIQADLAVRLISLGLNVDDREWTPHLTIGRVRTSRGFGDTAALLRRDSGKVFGVIRVGQLVLMRSELRPDGPVYSPLHTAGLGPAGTGE